MAIVVWDTAQDAAFKAAFPEFANVPFARTLSLFNLAAGSLLDNSGGSPVDDVNFRTYLFYLLIGHLLLLFGFSTTGSGGASQPDNTPPGRINSATEGTVSSGFEYQIPQGSMSAPWYLQTKYGAMFWTATVRFRSVRYVANGGSGIGTARAYGVAPFNVPGGV
jgi:hypothetical protein